MGTKYKIWNNLSSKKAKDLDELHAIVHKNRDFKELDELKYDDEKLEIAVKAINKAILQNKKIALYADYDVDGTMSCTSWIWFLKEINYTNFTYYIPDRFKEGYGLNLEAVQTLVKNHGAEIIITMDTGITANKEAEWCRSQGIDFVCTDHHKIQADQIPDAIILNPKCNPDPMYQELCGCGITFVLLRRLAQSYSVSQSLWSDLLALAGMATICDLVPLNPVNHRIARLGVKALLKSKRPVLQKLIKKALDSNTDLDEQDIGFKLGPRINAVGRMAHSHKVIEAFVDDKIDSLLDFMEICNDKRKKIQQEIIDEACDLAVPKNDDPILFLGGNWHQGVVGIAASRLVDEFWKPVWLFEENKKTGICKGSARSIQGFDITEAMVQSKIYFDKFGGHQAAGGFSFAIEKKDLVHKSLLEYASNIKKSHPNLWISSIDYDCELSPSLLNINIFQLFEQLKPFGFGFKEPLFTIEFKIHKCQFYYDKVTNKPKHTCVFVKTDEEKNLKIIFFNNVYTSLQQATKAYFLVTIQKNKWQGNISLNLIGHDYKVSE